MKTKGNSITTVLWAVLPLFCTSDLPLILSLRRAPNSLEFTSISL